MYSGHRLSAAYCIATYIYYLGYYKNYSFPFSGNLSIFPVRKEITEIEVDTAQTLLLYNNAGAQLQVNYFFFKFEHWQKFEARKKRSKLFKI